MRYQIILIVLFCSLLDSQQLKAYSVLTHEAVIDAAWKPFIVPALKLKYPSVDSNTLNEAHAYAYGGAVAPDMGYFPKGSKLFTNLVHYVRSGDFVKALLDEAKDINEYAFALGFLAHYNADRYGHPYINRGEPLVYPKLRRKFGDTITYEEAPAHHIMMEFGFDVLQTARGNYASQAYHDFIGFKVADSLLLRTFPRVYGLQISDLFSNFPKAVSTFRWSVKRLMPELTRSVWAAKRQAIRQSTPGITRRSYIYHVRRVDYFREFGRERDKPGTFANVFAFVIRIMPKVGPLKKLKFTNPGPEAEKLFVQSFDTVVVHYSYHIRNESSRKKMLDNVDFDTGHKTTKGEYALADKTYNDWLLKLKEMHFTQLSPAIKQNLSEFYAVDSGDQENISTALQELQAVH